jgi:hypothetical protein
MSEGFDVGLEMSGSAAAFQDMLANMSHGAKIALLGIPAHEIPIDMNTVIFNISVFPPDPKGAEVQGHHAFVGYLAMFAYREWLGAHRLPIAHVWHAPKAPSVTVGPIVSTIRRTSGWVTL